MTLLARIALALVALAGLLVFVGAGITSLGCCAIDCDKFPEKCAENRQRQRNAGVLALGGILVTVGATAAAVRVGRRGTEEAR